MTKELGYEDEHDIELLKQFITYKFFVQQLNEPKKSKQDKAKCVANLYQTSNILYIIVSMQKMVIFDRDCFIQN